MRTIVSRLAIIVLCALGVAFSTDADAVPPAIVESLPTTIDPNCRERFLTEAVPAWKDRKARLRGIEIELTWADHYPTDTEHPDPPMLLSTYCILHDGVSRRLDRGESVDVTNGRYSFKVRRSGDTYALKYCERWGQDGPQPLAGWLEEADGLLAMDTAVWWLPIEGMLVNEDFDLTGAARGVNDAGDDTVWLVWRYTGEASDSDVCLQPDGVYWAELIPARNWIVARSGVISSLTRHSLTSMPFEARVTTRHQEWNGVPMPAVNRVEAVDLRENVVIRIQEYRFGTPRKCTRPTDDFFLPRYGISDDPLPSMPLSCDVP